MEIVRLLLPETVVSLWALIVLMVAGIRHGTPEDQRLAGNLTAIGIISALITTWWMWSQAAAPSTAHMVTQDAFRFAATSIILLGALGAVLISQRYLIREGVLIPEYYAMMLFAILGMMIMCAAADLIVVFLGIELMSLSVYVLVGLNRRSAHGAEGALKYFMLGAFASGFLLYGIALIYGATGSTEFAVIAVNSVAVTDNLLMVAGVGLLLVGLGFKVAAVPFHMWTPDVYDAAPTPITAFMAASVKAAGFAVVVRLLVMPLAGSAELWGEVLWWLAAATMVGGNLVALAQRKVKRMLAYSSIGHAGYLLTAMAGGTPTAASAYLFYVLAYTIMTVGALAVVGLVGRQGERELRVDDLAGLASKRPWLAFAMAVFMLSLLGFPGTAGFIGKWFVLSAAVEAEHLSLAVVLVVASVVSAGYYLPVIMQMYMQPASSDAAHEQVERGGPTAGVIAVATALLLILGWWPGPAMNAAREASESLRPGVEFTLADRD